MPWSMWLRDRWSRGHCRQNVGSNQLYPNRILDGLVGLTLWRTQWSSRGYWGLNSIYGVRLVAIIVPNESHVSDLNDEIYYLDTKKTFYRKYRHIRFVLYTALDRSPRKSFEFFYVFDALYFDGLLCTMHSAKPCIRTEIDNGPCVKLGSKELRIWTCICAQHEHMYKQNIGTCTCAQHWHIY